MMAAAIAAETVRALPMIIDGIRARGYEIAPVYELLGKTRADVMAPLPPGRTLGGAAGPVGLLAVRCRHRRNHLDLPRRRPADDRTPHFHWSRGRL